MAFPKSAVLKIAVVQLLYPVTPETGILLKTSSVDVLPIGKGQRQDKELDHKGRDVLAAVVASCLAFHCQYY